MGTGFILEPLVLLQKLLTTGLPKITVRALTGGDVDTQADRIIVSPPAVLIAIPSVQLDARNDHIRLTYQSSARVLCYVGAENLSGDEAERIGALTLLTQVCQILAGARLTLTEPNQGGRVRLASVALAQLEREGTWYLLEAAFEGMAQFQGAAA